MTLEELFCKTKETVFHCYKDGEWTKTYGFNSIHDPDYDEDIVEELDLSGFDEVRIFQTDPNYGTFVNIFDDDPDRDYNPQLKLTRVKLPNQIVWSFYEYVFDDDDDVIYESSYCITHYYSVTKDDFRELKANELTEDDYELSW